MFSEFIINRHLRPKQCLFQHRDINSQSVMQPQHSGQQPFNLTAPLLRSREWRLNLTHAARCPYAFFSRLQLYGKQEAPDLQITSYFREPWLSTSPLWGIVVFLFFPCVYYHHILKLTFYLNEIFNMLMSRHS